MIKADFIRQVLHDDKVHDMWCFYIDGNSEMEHIHLCMKDVEYLGADALVFRSTNGLELISFDHVKKVVIR